MTAPAFRLPNSTTAIRQRLAAGAITLRAPLGMTFARILLFAAYQAVLSLANINRMVACHRHSGQPDLSGAAVVAGSAGRA